jgi:1-deoxy-D-xylulose-5-phosphate reductoisomerase
MEAVTRHDALLLPIDSEHNALFQALPAGYDGDPVRAGVRRLLLTASGGPFRTRAPGELAHVTPDEACAHPRWVMGRKISVDSATMMNKGLEVIEAHWLFGVPRTAIEVVIHPQSVIHSLVEYVDGSVLAQLGNPDMRTPIAHALAWPERVDAGVVPLDLFKIARLDFEVPDLRRFPCLRIAFDALAVGGAAPVVLNAANECAVAAFLDGRLRYDRIAVAIDTVLAASSAAAPTSLDDVFAIDAQARVAADRWIDADASRIAPVAAIDAPTRPAPHR